MQDILKEEKIEQCGEGIKMKRKPEDEKLAIPKQLRWSDLEINGSTPQGRPFGCSAMFCRHYVAVISFDKTPPDSFHKDFNKEAKQLLKEFACAVKKAGWHVRIRMPPWCDCVYNDGRCRVVMYNKKPF